MVVQRFGASFVLVLCFAVPATCEERLQIEVDRSFDEVARAVEDAGLEPVLSIDHARLAAAEGVDMPPSRVQLFSDARLNSTLLRENIRAGLDLPFRVLAYEQDGATVVSYTSPAFLARRHDLKDSSALSQFDERLNEVFTAATTLSPVAVPVQNIETDFAVIELRSKYDVPVTVARLKEAVMAQADTIWFGEIDFQSSAAQEGVSLVPAQLLLFGGPAPGGIAMAQFPAIGLDAFCQKLLVYEGDDGKAIVLFNDIAALAKHYYGTSIDPHAMLNKRLSATFSTALN